MPETTVAAIIRNCNGDILLTRRNIPPFKGQWCLPGGHIDPFETAKTAVTREVREETGLDFDARFFNYYDEIFPDRDLHAVVIVFTGPGSGEILMQKQEVSSVSWFSLEEVRSLSLAFGHKTILEEYALHASTELDQA